MYLYPTFNNVQFHHIVTIWGCCKHPKVVSIIIIIQYSFYVVYLFYSWNNCLFILCIILCQFWCYVNSCVIIIMVRTKTNQFNFSFPFLYASSMATVLLKRKFEQEMKTTSDDSFNVGLVLSYYQKRSQEHTTVNDHQ